LQNISLILLSAGDSSRFGSKTKKQWLYQGEDPLWLKVAKDFKKLKNFKEIIVVAKEDDISYMSKFGDFKFVKGGKSRQESLSNALESVRSKWVMVSDVARCCIDKKMVKRVIKNRKNGDCIVPVLRVADTIYYEEEPIKREKVRLIQTPQLSKTKVLKKAFARLEQDFTDESSAIKAFGGKVYFVKGSKKAHKLTTKEDLKKLPCLKKPKNRYFSGIGIDIHPFEARKKMYLGGIEIKAEYGFKAHSDGDVAIHSLIDALLGASQMGDIGELFPDNDKKYENIDSKKLLAYVVDLIYQRGFEIVNIDLSIIAQKPKISPYKTKIIKTLAKICQIPENRVNIKATTAEKMGFIGREEGVLVQSIATLKYFDWREIK
jgi:2-C-methyl-D-erythritol 4-phosphate cytidylyltransferase/2-C-methyl-D-erythritol 2,4-cyclodiphosphate synthase